MTPTEGKVAKPERRWDCRRGIPQKQCEITLVKSTKNCNLKSI